MLVLFRKRTLLVDVTAKGLEGCWCVMVSLKHSDHSCLTFETNSGRSCSFTPGKEISFACLTSLIFLLSIRGTCHSFISLARTQRLIKRRRGLTLKIETTTYRFKDNYL